VVLRKQEKITEKQTILKNKRQALLRMMI